MWNRLRRWRRSMQDVNAYLELFSQLSDEQQEEELRLMRQIVEARRAQRELQEMHDGWADLTPGQQRSIWRLIDRFRARNRARKQ